MKTLVPNGVLVCLALKTFALVMLAAQAVSGAAFQLGPVADDRASSKLAATVTELGASTVVLDPFNGDPRETCHPETAWHALATVAAAYRRTLV